MKRSDMIKLITEIKLDSSTSFSLNKKEATIILNKLESAGMLPPPTKTDTVTSYLVYCYYPEVIGNATDQLDIANSQLWEPEDD